MQTPSQRPVVACHCAAHHLATAGPAQVADRLRDLARVDTLLLNAFNEGVAADRVASDTQHLAFAWDPAITAATGIAPKVSTSKALLPYDRLAETGMQVHARILEYALRCLVLPDEVSERDHRGQRTGRPCWRHPSYRAFWPLVAASLVAHYPLAGVHFGAERNGPLSETLTFNRPGAAGCFCVHCRAAGAAQGIDVDAAQRGFQALSALMEQPPSRDRRLLRVLGLWQRYPEILAWQRLWTDGRNEAFAAMRQAVHAQRADATVGFHVWQYSCSLDPFGRSSCDYGDWAAFSDHIKPCLYQDAAGCRGVDLAREFLAPGLFEGFSPELIHEWCSELLGDGGRAGREHEDIRAHGLGADYVTDHVATARAALDRQGSACRLWAGIGVNVESRQVDLRAADVVGESVVAALDAGADGIVLCREYEEMTDAALAAAGRVLDQRLGSLV